MKPKPATLIFVVAALVGVLFAAVSTFDFVQHLDRQLHGLHCSFIPGIGGTDASGASGCAAALMSPYSSLFRDMTWGGLPIALPGLAVYAFLLFLGVDLWINRKETSRNSTLFLMLVSIVPVISAIVMAYISATQVHAFCKLCVGMYSSAAVMFGTAIWLWRQAVRPGFTGAVPVEEPRGIAPFILPSVEGLAFVVVPVVAYLALVPDAAPYLGKCGNLVKPADPYGVLVSLDKNANATPMIEVLDPLCPYCRGFERRFSSSGLDPKVHRQALLFPLDSTCNWMVASSVHPGACDLSEAVLCADDRAHEVLAWAFDNQEQLTLAGKGNPGAPKELVLGQFPELKQCMGSPEVKSRINKSLRWAVANQLPVMIPQVYVDGVTLCDEDMDLGMEFALSRLLDPAFLTANNITPVKAAKTDKAPKAPKVEKVDKAPKAEPKAEPAKTIPTAQPAEPQKATE